MRLPGRTPMSTAPPLGICGRSERPATFVGFLRNSTRPVSSSLGLSAAAVPMPRAPSPLKVDAVLLPSVSLDHCERRE